MKSLLVREQVDGSTVLSTKTKYIQGHSTKLLLHYGVNALWCKYYKYEINYKLITNYKVNKLKLVISISQVSNISSEEISKLFAKQPDWSIHFLQIICDKYNMEKK